MIEVNRLSKSYGSVHAVADLSFDVRAGEVLGFLGPNGAGKSTTMKILTGYLCPTAGTARVGGLDVVEQPLEVRRRIGYLPEHAPVYSDMTVYEYLGFIAHVRGIPRRDRRRAIEVAVSDCGLAKVIGRPIGHLSKGYRQRTCFAQALVHRPEVLILDEPTSGLDPNQIVEIRNLVLELAGERAIVWSTHILAEVEALCERVLIINEGKEVAIGSPADLKARIPDARPLRIGIDAAESSEAIRARLGELAGAEEVEVLSGNGSGECELLLRPTADADVRDDVVALARSASWKLRTLVSIEPTLEDVFRYLTGRAAQPAAVLDRG